MNRTETSPSDSSVTQRSRIPHVVGVVAGIAMLAGIVLLWQGQPADQSPNEHSALGSTLNVAAPNPVQVIPTSMETASRTESITPDTDNAASPAKTILPSTVADDASATSHNNAILGTWKQYSHGHRLLNVLEDGTATIDVKLDGLSALAFGEKLHFDITWTIEDDTLRFKTTGGTPEASINAVKSIYGDDRVYQILEINDKQMLLREGDEEKTPWDRVVDE